MGAWNQAALSQAPESEERIRESRQGWVVRVEPSRQVWVDYPGNVRGPLTTRISPTLDVLAQSLSRIQAETRVDGERMVITGRKEVALECGKASLTLRHDGTVVPRGLNLVSEVETHRIRGRKVRIN